MNHDNDYTRKYNIDNFIRYNCKLNLISLHDYSNWQTNSIIFFEYGEFQFSFEIFKNLCHQFVKTGYHHLHRDGMESENVALISPIFHGGDRTVI